MDFLFWVLAALVIVCVLLALLRFFSLRSRGTTVLMRGLPAKGMHGWRHGKIQYEGNYLQYYKLRSLLPKADFTFERTTTDVVSHRELTEPERDFMPTASRIIEVSSLDQHFEIAGTRHAIMALISWIESAPDPRQQKTDYRSLSQRIGRQREQG